MADNIWVKAGLKRPTNFYDITPEMARMIAGNLNFIQKLSLSIKGSVHLDNLLFNGWPGKVPLYLFKCDFHGFEINYPYGYGEILMCTECFVEHNCWSPDLSMNFSDNFKANEKSDGDEEKTVPVISN